MKRSNVIIIALLLSTLCLISMNSVMNREDDWEVPANYQKLKNPYANDPDDDQIGRQHYAVHCKSCHGTKGKGDGTKAKELKTKMPDLTSNEFKAQSDGAMYYKTYFGRDEMPAFDKKIKDEEDKWLLINYIKGL